ncbi:MAG: hypothetical protein M3Q69_03675 [Acidobacteriota bacterium]|nr:hypothetical protein [Acidobacteriota bacterium]
MHPIRAAARYSQAIHVIADILVRLKLDSMFVGGVARAAWMGTELDNGAVDLLAVMTQEQKRQVAMMASNRGFRVDQDELEATEELDLIPLNFVGEEGEIRVHVLLASNALYGRMVSVAVATEIGERTIRVPRAEDLALLLLLGEDQEAVEHLTALPEFDLPAFRERLASIGLGGEAVAP